MKWNRTWKTSGSEGAGGKVGGGGWHWSGISDREGRFWLDSTFPGQQPFIVVSLTVNLTLEQRRLLKSTPSWRREKGAVTTFLCLCICGNFIKIFIYFWKNSTEQLLCQDEWKEINPLEFPSCTNHSYTHLTNTSQLRSALPSSHQVLPVLATWLFNVIFITTKPVWSPGAFGGSTSLQTWML